jgi:2-amino-4-hydroxy-6-hydroxymethyldihydropteridine diphosphokinase
MIRAAIGLGSNQGDAAGHIRSALDRLAELGIVVARSSLYSTPPWGVTDQPPFVNAAALLDTVLSPHHLLDALKRFEREAGRVATYRWGPRLLDLDILTYGEERIDEPGLTIPHARLAERAFVLVPLAAIDPRYISLRDTLPPGERAAVVELDGQ